MRFDFFFIMNSVLLGVGLAMDAFSLSIVNAISENNMSRARRSAIAGVYAFFQFAMPVIGWICVHTIATTFVAFQKFIPWIALILLLYIGIKMIVESIADLKTGNTEDFSNKKITFAVLMMQGIATSIDALSVGFTIAEYNAVMALTASFIIAVVTFIICMTGLLLGKAAGEKLSWRAQIFGGCILIFIGIEIFVKGMFF